MCCTVFKKFGSDITNILFLTDLSVRYTFLNVTRIFNLRGIGLLLSYDVSFFNSSKMMVLTTKRKERKMF